MIENKVYRCEVCGTTYAEKAMCRECETFHLRLPAGAEHVVTDTKYLAKNSAHNPYPQRLTIQFADGHKALYEYRCPLGEVR